MHYLDSHGNACNDCAHNKLPFKANHETGSQGVLCYVIPESSVRVNEPHRPLAAPRPVAYTALLQSGFPFSLFHPPSVS